MKRVYKYVKGKVDSMKFIHEFTLLLMKIKT